MIAIGEAIETYLTALAARGLRPSTITSNRIALQHLARVLARRGVCDMRHVTRHDIAAFSSDLLDHRYRRSPEQPWKPLAPVTRYDRLFFVRQFFAWLVGQRLLVCDPSLGAKPVWPGRGLPRRVLSESELARLLAAPDRATALGLRDRAMLELLYSSGLRIGELAALDLTDVDLTSGILVVRSGKGAKSRLVPFGQSAASALTRYIRDGRPQLLTSPRVAALFIASKAKGRGRRMWTCSIADRIALAAEAAGIERPVTAHMLRHSFATHLLRAGASVRHVQEMLGHARIDTTEIYTHLAIADVAEAHARSHPRGARRR